MSKLVELNAKLPQKIDAKSEAREAEIIAKKIANGEYPTGTFINGKRIESPTIKAGEFYGAKYYDLEGVGRLTSSNYGYTDLIYRNHKNNYNIFQVRDGIGAVGLYLGNSLFASCNLISGDILIEPGVKVLSTFG